MKTEELRKLIRESIYEKLQQYPQDNKTMLERDDVGQFYTVVKPKGGEKLEELFFETDVDGYGDKCSGREVAARVKSESRARNIAGNLIKAKIHELSTAKQGEINEKLKEIKATEATVGALNHYYKLREIEPGKNNDQLGKHTTKLEQLKRELAELQKHKKEIGEGKVPVVDSIPLQEEAMSAIAKLADEVDKAAREGADALAAKFHEVDFFDDLKKLIMDKVMKKNDPEVAVTINQKAEEEAAKQAGVGAGQAPVKPVVASGTALNEKKKITATITGKKPIQKVVNKK